MAQVRVQHWLAWRNHKPDLCQLQAIVQMPHIMASGMSSKFMKVHFGFADASAQTADKYAQQREMHVNLHRISY